MDVASLLLGCTVAYIASLHQVQKVLHGWADPVPGHRDAGFQLCSSMCSQGRSHTQYQALRKLPEMVNRDTLTCHINAL